MKVFDINGGGVSQSLSATYKPVEVSTKGFVGFIAVSNDIRIIGLCGND
jgi:hypothetical protein